MPQSVLEGRFEARLKRGALPLEELIKLAAKGAWDSADARRYADERLAVHDPLSIELRDAVLLSPDLAPQLLKALELKQCVVATVCKAWSVAWAAKTRRILREVPLPEPDFHLAYPVALAALPGGEELCIADSSDATAPGHSCLRIVDKQMKLKRTLGRTSATIHGMNFNYISGLAAGDGGLYVAEYGDTVRGSRLRRIQLDTFAVAAERVDSERFDYIGLALAPGGLLFVLAVRPDDEGEDEYQLLALDALTLAERFRVGKKVLGEDELVGLAVSGDELFVGTRRLIHVLSLAGERLRIIKPLVSYISSLCCTADRLGLIEQPVSGSRVVVLTPEGATMQEFSLRHVEVSAATCAFDGRLLLGQDGGGFRALTGV